MKLITYLTFGEQCEEALNFYKDVLGGEIMYLSRMGESPMKVGDNLKNKIMHARLRLGDNEIYMSDTFDSTSLKPGNNVSLSLDIPDSEHVEKLFNNLSAGGTISMPLQKTYWAARFGMFIDKFGIQWLMNCESKS